MLTLGSSILLLFLPEAEVNAMILVVLIAHFLIVGNDIFNNFFISFLAEEWLNGMHFANIKNCFSRHSGTHCNSTGSGG